MVEIRVLTVDDLDLLVNLGEGLFDNSVDPAQARAFLESQLHEMVMAFDSGRAVSFASGTVLLHPDKMPTMFINEVGTHEGFRKRGFARAVTEALIRQARALDCEGVWLATEPDNAPALALYRAMGGDEQPIVGFAWDGAFDAD
jgi:aminoglycoside 6'-N-acetyltransferase I